MYEVWVDEGVKGRTKRRHVCLACKKLKSDPAIGIVAVHGVGYRMLMKEV